MVNCEHRVRLDAYHDGELPPAERSIVEAHVRNCPSCAAELDTMRKMSAAFAATSPPKPSYEQLLQLARSVRAEPYDARMLLRLFRRTAIAAVVVLACAIAAGVWLSQRTKASAHEAMVLDHLAAWSQSAAYMPDPITDQRQAEQQVRFAQWIADDLRGRQEER